MKRVASITQPVTAMAHQISQIVIRRSCLYIDRQTVEKPSREMLENKITMLGNRNTRRLSLDMLQRGERISERGIFKYMDLRFPAASYQDDVNEVACECCGLSEDCTAAYIRHTRARFYGKWVCGLCSEAVSEESSKMGGVRSIVREEALHAHMKVCRAFNTTIRVNPAMALAYSMTKILRTTSHKTTIA